MWVRNTSVGRGLGVGVVGRLAPPVVALLVGVAAVPGSASAEPRFAAGAKAGFVLTGLTGEGIDASPIRTTPKLGPAAALVVRVGLGRWAVEGEVGFSDRGATLEPVGSSETIALHLYYVDLPVVVVRELDLGRTIVPRFALGAALSLKVAADVEVAPVALDRVADVGLVLGAGIVWRRPDGDVPIEVRYLGGLRSLADAEPDTRGHAFALTAGYVF
jgi:hypothetical protein